MSKPKITIENIFNHQCQLQEYKGKTYIRMRDLLEATVTKSFKQYTNDPTYIEAVGKIQSYLLDLKFLGSDNKLYKQKCIDFPYGALELLARLNARSKIIKEIKQNYITALQGSIQSLQNRQLNIQSNNKLKDYIKTLENTHDNAYSNALKQLSIIAFGKTPKELQDIYKIKKGRSDYSLESNNHICLMENTAIALHEQSDNKDYDNFYYVIIKDKLASIFKPRAFNPLSLDDKITQRALLK